MNGKKPSASRNYSTANAPQDSTSAAGGSDPETELDRSHPPLSPTERRVLSLLLQRMTEKQVAEELGRSPNTVHVHVRNIYRKLGVRKRHALFELMASSSEDLAGE